MKKKGVVKSSRLPKLARAILILIFIGAFLTVTRGVARLISSGGRVEEARERLEEAKTKQNALKEQLEAITSDLYREKVARDQLGLAKPGEIVIMLPNEEILRRLSPRLVDSESLKPPEPNWKKWAKLFFEI